MRCADKGFDLVRITVQGKREANAAMQIREGLFQKGYDIPLCADMHFQPQLSIFPVCFPILWIPPFGSGVVDVQCNFTTKQRRFCQSATAVKLVHKVASQQNIVRLQIRNHFEFNCTVKKELVRGSALSFDHGLRTDNG